MSFLKISDKEQLKLIGAQVPLSMHRDLTLYCIAKGTNKSQLLMEIINEWANNRFDTEDTLIIEIGAMIATQWKDLKARRVDYAFSAFIEEVTTELISKGLDKEQIEKIIQITNENI